MHGKNEEMVGKVFQGKRDGVYIQTKVHDHDEKRMRQSVERSLRRLRTDYIDVLVWHDLHRPEEVSDERLHEFMAKMKKEGKARYTGFSAHGNGLPLREAMISLSRCCFGLYNFTHSRFKRHCCLGLRRGQIVAMKTQAGGYKKGKMEGLSPHQLH
jgi:aryl-alcohol dehydrogenase-like predicted oxidoreductase